MIARLIAIFRQAPILASAFVLALCLTLWFGGRATMHAVYWADPRHQNQEIEGWMTLGYIGKSWHIPPPELEKSLEDIWPKSIGRRVPPIKRLAEETGHSEDELISRLQIAIETFKANPPLRN